MDGVAFGRQFARLLRHRRAKPSFARARHEERRVEQQTTAARGGGRQRPLSDVARDGRERRDDAGCPLANEPGVG